MPSSPVVTAALQATAISSISNVLAQLLESYQDQIPLVFDFYEFLRFLICALITAPPNFYWQGWLEKTWPGYSAPPTRFRGKDDMSSAEKGDRVAQKEPKAILNRRNTAIKWFIDCIFLGAIFNTVAFLLIIGVLKGLDAATIRQTIREQTWPIIWAGYKIWPFANIIAQVWVPWQRRIVFFSCIGLFWGIYMSLISARIGTTEDFSALPASLGSTEPPPPAAVPQA